MSGVKTEVTHASIDICTRCQLKCVSCSTSKGIIRNGIIKEGAMSFDMFKSILDNNQEIKEVELSNWGEIFLNPEILKILEYAYNNEVSLTCSNGSNFNSVKDDVLEGLVKYKFKCLNLSIDGATQETYEQYRKCGNLANVISNIKRLNFFKAQYNSPFPKVSWQFIIFGHNEHEIGRVKELCSELDMVFNPKMNHSDFSPVINAEKVKQDAGIDYASRAEYKLRYKTEYKHPCYQCQFSPQINWNGDVLGCCVNKWKTLGNVGKQSIKDVVNSDIYQYMLDVLYGKEEANDNIPCYYCPNLKKIKEQPLTDEGLKKYSSYLPPALR